MGGEERRIEEMRRVEKRREKKRREEKRGCRGEVVNRRRGRDSRNGRNMRSSRRSEGEARVSDHITQEAPVLVRSPKLSCVGPG